MIYRIAFIAYDLATEIAGQVWDRLDQLRCAIGLHQYGPITPLSDTHHTRTCKRCPHTEWIE